MRIKKTIIILGISLPLALSASVIPTPMQWLNAYETIAFNTADGDISLNEYAIYENGWIIRTVDKNLGQFQFTENQDDILGKTKVKVNCEKCKYYSEFRYKNGRIERVPMAKQDYDGLRYIKNYRQPEKTELLNAVDSMGEANAAIALDGTSDGSASDITLVSSLSWNHVVTSADNSLISVSTASQDSRSTDRPVSGVTYNAQALTKVREDNDNTYNITSGIWYKVAPSTGTNAVVITFAGTNSYVMGGAVSLSGVHQTVTVDASNTQSGTGTETPAVLTVADNSWVMDSSVSHATVDVAYADGGTQTTLYIIENGSFLSAQAGYSGPKTPAGTVTHTWTCSGTACSSTGFIASIVSYAPAAPAAPVSSPKIQLKSSVQFKSSVQLK